MAFRDTVRRFSDRVRGSLPSFAGTPYPSGNVASPAQNAQELGGSGTFNFGGFIRGEDFNPEMDSLTAIKNLDIMRRSDAQTNAALQVVMQPIRSADKSVDPAGTKEIDFDAAKFVEWNLTSGEAIVWDDFLRQALLMLVFGFYIFEKVWDVKTNGKYEGRIYYRKLSPRPPKTIWQWFTDEDGELLSIKQLAVKAGTYQFLDIPADKLVRFTYNQEGDNFAGISVLRSAYPHWLIKSNLYVVDAIRAVRFGAGIPKAKLLAGFNANKGDKENLIATLAGMSSHQFSYILEPENVDISIMVPEGNKGGAEILPTINHHNEQITANVLARFLDMGGRSMGGSSALGASAMEFFQDAEVSLGNLIEDVIDKQLIRPLIDMNFDINELSGYPRFRFSGIKSQKLEGLATIISSLSKAGMRFDDLETQNTFRQKMDLPELSAPLDDPRAGINAPPGGPTSGGSPAGGGNTRPANTRGTSRAAVPHSPRTTAQTGRTAGVARSTQPPEPPDSFRENQGEQSTRPLQPLSAADVDVTSNAVDHTPEYRTNGLGVVLRNVTQTDAVANTPRLPRTVEGQTTHTSRTVPPTAHMARSSTIGSPSDADTEGHTSSVADSRRHNPLNVVRSASLNERQTALADPATTAIRTLATLKTANDAPGPSSETRNPTNPSPLERPFWRAPTDLESRVLDLREMPRQLDAHRQSLAATLRHVREEQILRVARLVANTSPTNEVKPPLIGKMVADVVKAATAAFQFGFDSVESELRRQRDRTFAMSDAMPFPVAQSGIDASVSAMMTAAARGRSDAGTPGYVDGVSIVGLAQRASIEPVPLDELIATQTSLTVTQVMPSGMPHDLPIVVAIGTRLFILDGHKRLTKLVHDGQTTTDARVIRLADRAVALGAPRTSGTALEHLKSGAAIRVKSVVGKLVASAQTEAMRLRRAGWERGELEEGIKIHLGQLSERDVVQLANVTINEANALGRAAAGEEAKQSGEIEIATYSALLDNDTCDVCREIDSVVFVVGSADYEENMPPNQHCAGWDQCRCTYIYTLKTAA